MKAPGRGQPRTADIFHDYERHDERERRVLINRGQDYYRFLYFVENDCSGRDASGHAFVTPE